MASHRGLGIAMSLVAAVLLILGVCEALGWPFLAAPLQSRLASALDRKVDLGSGLRIHLLGGVRLQAAHLEIGAPSWSSTPHTFLADDVDVHLRYEDLWHAYRAGTLHVAGISAHRFDMQLERLADGRATWEFKPHAPSAGASVTHLPTFGRMRVDTGTVTLRDAKTPLDASIQYSLDDGTVAGSSTSEQKSAAHGLRLNASGHYKTSILKIEAQTDGVLLLEGRSSAKSRQPLRIDALIGQAHLIFSGAVVDPLSFAGLQGHFEVSGPSLANAGEPLGVTLPSTPHFDTSGTIVKEGDVWKAVFSQADIGSSKLSGAFVFDKRGKTPLLSGKLDATRLALSDLAPAIGHATSEQKSEQKPASTRPVAASNAKLLPDRPFDVPSLRVMNANVLFDIAELDMGSAFEAMRPLRAHLTLDDGALTLDQLVARTAEGELEGKVALDGRESLPRWTADIRLRGVQLARWLHQKRGKDDPPYISGALDGSLVLRGRGRSVSEILGDANGEVRMHLSDASLSHLALKAAGLDVAGALKVFASGDKALAIRCNIADLAVARGVLRPKAFVVSLDNATLWAAGSASLKDEQFDLRVVSSPKDFSPLTLRTPIDVKGTFAHPSVSIEPSRLAGHAAAAVLLGLLNPLAALVPLFDFGARAQARKEDLECASLARRIRVQ